MEEHHPSYHAAQLLIRSGLAIEQLISLALEALENEIQILAKDPDQLFSSTQSRIQYLFAIQKIDKELYSQITVLRIQATNKEIYTTAYFESIIYCWLKCIALHTGEKVPLQFEAIQFDPSLFIEKKSSDTKKDIRSSRISIIKFDEQELFFEFIFSNELSEIQKLQLSAAGDKKIKLLKQAVKYLKLPFDIYVHELHLENNIWTAEEFIILPDYLIDVTAIASCYNLNGSSPLKHLVHLFYYSPPSYSTLVGTTVNQFLDDLILNPQLRFEEVAQNLFHHNPIAFSILDDSTILKYYETIKQHFNNIKSIVDLTFNNPFMQLKDCMMEPSFYSVEYGIQGRLDLFYEDPSDFSKWIIELKSGKPYLPNRYGINAEHHAQIMLYYLLVKSVFDDQYPIKSHILYSSQSENPLRYAPYPGDLKKELIYIRNSIIILHLHLAFRNETEPFIFELLNEHHFKSTESYTKRDAGNLLTVFNSLNFFEKDYLKEFTGFIAREQFISKMGRSNVYFTEGLASLWLLNEQEKLPLFMILPNLNIKEIITNKDEYPILILKNDSPNEIISNFRIGDTLVLYAYPDVLKTQIYKCTLVDMDLNQFQIRLRCRQFPAIEQARLHSWNLEHDVMDRSFQNQYQGMFDFALAEEARRNLILGIKEPELNSHSFDLEGLQIPKLIEPVLTKILKAKDYFLLWGPPGSGKTNLIIKHLIEILLKKTGENILLLAYTNRAVDEICEAIESIQNYFPFEYIRVGSRFAVQAHFRKNLLEEKISHLKSRKQLQRTFNDTRVFIATLASLQGKKELFYLKQFDTVIIDEASQILESQLVGLLSRFNRFILIGDHMQLPAVTAQTEEESKIKSGLLLQNGFDQLSTSYFERMLRLCTCKKWEHSYEMLEYQGRMHQELMAFPAQLFYQNKLNILPGPGDNRQSNEYNSYFQKSNDIDHTILTTQRTLFVPCIEKNSLFQNKTNLLEAIIVSEIIKKIQNIYQQNKMEWNLQTVGVITPFRAQIAQIKSQLLQAGIDLNTITVDTAERYQGGSRNIIILSTVISEESQLAQISSLNSNGVDRKLNVALTRAKEQIILVGNPEVLNTSAIYKELIASYYHWENAKNVIAI